MLDYRAKLGVLLTRLCLLEEAIEDDGLKSAILRTTDGNIAFFVVLAENINEIVFTHAVEKARIEAEDTSAIADEIAHELFAALAVWDENKTDSDNADK